MPLSKSTYHSSVYLHFKEIESGEHREIIRFYEENARQIQQLEFLEFFELQIAYLKALFEIGSYNKLISLADKAIEASIQHNIKYHEGEDVFQKLLFTKAAAHYNLHEYQKAEHILRELIKMNPHNEAVILLMRKCLLRQKPLYVKNTRAISVFIFLTTAMVICIEVLFVRTFFPEFVWIVEFSRIFLFLTGIVILISGDIIHYWKVHHQSSSMVRASKNRKAS